MNSRTSWNCRQAAGLYTYLDGPYSRVPLGHFEIGLIALERKPHLTTSVIDDRASPTRIGHDARGWSPLLAILCSAAGRGRQGYGLLARCRLRTVATLDALASVANSTAYGIQYWRTVESLHASEERFALAVQGTADGFGTGMSSPPKFTSPPSLRLPLGFEG